MIYSCVGVAKITTLPDVLGGFIMGRLQPELKELPWSAGSR